MSALLDDAISAHGGLDRWQRVRGLRLTVRIGGAILASRLASPRRRTLETFVDTARPHVRFSPFPRAGHTGIFDGDHVRIENAAGAIVAAREIQRRPDGRPRRRWPWSDLDVLYFFGYAMWNYSVIPYVFRWPGFDTREGEPWRERDGEVWRRLHVAYPAAFPAHCREQTMYFDERGWLRRLDYTADVFGPIARGAHYCHAHRTFDGLVFPTHRVVWWRLPSGQPLRLASVMEGWVDDVIPVPYDAQDPTRITP
jgi:hypothetical protein